jgi:hypothetical protein
MSFAACVKPVVNIWLYILLLLHIPILHILIPTLSPIFVGIHDIVFVVFSISKAVTGTVAVTRDYGIAMLDTMHIGTVFGTFRTLWLRPILESISGISGERSDVCARIDGIGM